MEKLSKSGLKNLEEKAKSKHKETKPEKATKDAVAKRVIEKGKLDYKYPEGMEDAAEKKKFRTSVRKKIASFEKKIKSATKKNEKKVVEELTANMAKYVQKHKN